MADEYHAGICTGNLWNSSRNFPIGTYSPCSMMLSDNIGSFGWSMDVMNNMDSKLNRFACDDGYDHSTSIWDDLSLIHGDESGQNNNNSSRLNYHQELVEMGATNWASKQFSEINDENSMNASCQDGPMTNFVGSNNLFESSSTVLQNLFEELEYETPPNDHNNFTASSNNFSSSWSKLLASNPSTCSNNTTYWNNVAQKAYLDDSTSQENPNCTNNLRLKTKNELRVSMGKKNNIADEPAFKRPRIETPSHMPTFKVRKEKLGDRVTALQQLVSPFGKTDTASVLHEAIDYIKYLHDQVSALSTPYMKDLAQNTHYQQVNLSNEQSLRSQGLCLVPISSTYAMANQFW